MQLDVWGRLCIIVYLIYYYRDKGNLINQVGVMTISCAIRIDTGAIRTAETLRFVCNLNHLIICKILNVLLKRIVTVKIMNGEQYR